MPEPIDPVITRKEAAKILGVSVTTLQRLEKAGELQPIYVTERIIGYRESAIRRRIYENTKNK